MKGQSGVLTFHSLDNSGSVISCRPDLFRRQMEELAASGIPVVPLANIQQRPGALALTFDDGFGNFLDHALPVLTEFNLPATVFVVSGYCGQSNNWPSQPVSAPRMQLMSWGDLRTIPKLISIGAHTVTHPNLSILTPNEVWDELQNSRLAIEERLGGAVASLAYPYGRFNGAISAAARNLFSVGCTTALRMVSLGSDPILLPRIDACYLKYPSSVPGLMTVKGQVYIYIRRFLRERRLWFSR